MRQIPPGSEAETWRKKDRVEDAKEGGVDADAESERQTLPRPPILDSRVVLSPRIGDRESY
jgi:hypothetical protein